MKKIIIGLGSFFIIVILLGFYISTAIKERDNLDKLNTNISKLISLNKDLNIYLQHSVGYENFDTIEHTINSFKNELNKINQNKFLHTNHNSNKLLLQLLTQLNQNVKIKFDLIEKTKGYRAILNNSFRIIQKIKKSNKISKFNNLYTIIMTIDKNPEIDLEYYYKYITDKLQTYHTNNQYAKYFLIHSKIILSDQIKSLKLQNKIKKLQIEEILQDIYKQYSIYSTNSIKKAQISILIIFILLFIMVIIYFIYDYKLSLSTQELYKYQRIVENSDNIIVVTNLNEEITYVNKAFEKKTGYSFEEVKGKTPKLLQSGKGSKEFYQQMHDTIYSGKVWNGIFVNKKKNGEFIYEKASITPLMQYDKILEFVSIKLDITEEIKAQEKLKEQENQLIQQSKMAALGEMLENIAHQWRQPLSVISTISSSMAMKKEMKLDMSSDEEIENLDKITTTTQYLSETIDHFRDFFKPNKEKVNCNLIEVYQKTLKIVSSKFKSSNIELIENLADISIVTLDNELMQVLMNILNNAKDALNSTTNQRKLIIVDIYKKDNNAFIEVKDNAGGIKSDIIGKIFEPYFTTKHKSQGTGIGLYMSREMIVKHIKGDLSVQNETFIYDNITYTGAKFIIQIPIEDISEN